ncbi:hypothetical protein [Pseudomonas sp. MN1F]|uniref:hypothetical protein n=1 Tax=Pseudomonas sp. MN1F TaxID=1366632 RepID=UPI00128FC108|nr:hypothetical protein [Pseudomonas sp. MN1F]
MTLGAGDRIVATVNYPTNLPWMFKILPQLNWAIASALPVFIDYGLREEDT